MSKIASLAFLCQAAEADTDLREADDTPVTCTGGHRTTSPCPSTAVSAACAKEKEENKTAGASPVQGWERPPAPGRSGTFISSDRSYILATVIYIVSL